MYVRSLNFTKSVRRGSQVNIQSIMLMEIIGSYESPVIEVCEILVEVGFQGSGIGTEDMNVRDDISVG